MACTDCSFSVVSLEPFCSKAGYFSFICEFKVSNSDASSPEKFLKCEGFLDNTLKFSMQIAQMPNIAPVR